MQSETTGTGTATPEICREWGKSLLGSSDPAERRRGIEYILKAYVANDREAVFIIGKLMLEGMVTPSRGNPEDEALKILCNAAARGDIQARALMNSFCMKRYGKAVDTTTKTNDGPLVDFDGKPIKINRKGISTPVDAVLEYVGGVNTLTLSANILFGLDEDIDNSQRFKEAVLEGIMEWQGEYKVFGNQPLKVKMNLTTNQQPRDNVVVFPYNNDMCDLTQTVTNKIGTKAARERSDSIFGGKRSFTFFGLRWSAKSRKMIFILSPNGKFDDYEEIKHIAKHEFGHVLGLGDLYASPVDALGGVDAERFTELNGFHIEDKFYNLVMCDHHGPISNNDIEMIVLAYRKNRAQHYQPGRFTGRVSEALGRGN